MLLLYLSNAAHFNLPDIVLVFVEVLSNKWNGLGGHLIQTFDGEGIIIIINIKFNLAANIYLVIIQSYRHRNGIIISYTIPSYITVFCPQFFLW